MSEVKNQEDNNILLTQNENSKTSRKASEVLNNSRSQKKNKEYFFKKWAKDHQVIKSHLLQDYQSNLQGNYLYNPNTPNQRNTSFQNSPHNITSNNELSMMDSFRIQQKYLSGAGLTSNYLSTSILQHSIPSLTFGREERFKAEEPTTKDIQFIQPQTSLNSRSAGFIIFFCFRVIYQLTKNKESATTVKTSTSHWLYEHFHNIHHLVNTFLIKLQQLKLILDKPLEYLEKNTKKYLILVRYILRILKCRRLSLAQVIIIIYYSINNIFLIQIFQGSYNNEPRPLGQEEKAKQVTIKGRHGLKIEAYVNKNPGPGSYEINYEQIESARQRNLTVGKQLRFRQWLDGEKPGPGSYRLPSLFDKYTKKKGLLINEKLVQQQLQQQQKEEQTIKEQ